MSNQKKVAIIEERIEKIAQLMNNMDQFMDQFIEGLDLKIPEAGKKIIRDIINSKEINGLIDDIKNRRAPRLLMVGRTGVGKSSLINAIFGKYVARTSPVKIGTTSSARYSYSYDNEELFEVIDTRGIRESLKTGGNNAENALFQVIEEFNPDSILFLTSASDRSALKDEVIFLKEIIKKNKSDIPVLVVINRIDEIEPSREKVPSEYSEKKLKYIEQKEDDVKSLLENEGIENYGLFLVSSYIEWSDVGPDKSKDERIIEFDGRYNIEKLIDFLENNIDYKAAFSLIINSRIDEAIKKIAKKFVKAFSLASSGVATTPIPGSDIMVLFPLQLVLVTIIAYISGRDVTGKTAREFILASGGTFIAGYLFRTIFQQASKVLNGTLPGAGSALSSGIAYSGTNAIGSAAIRYYIDGATIEEAKEVRRKEMEAVKDDMELIKKMVKENNLK